MMNNQLVATVPWCVERAEEKHERANAGIHITVINGWILVTFKAVPVSSQSEVDN